MGKGRIWYRVGVNVIGIYEYCGVQRCGKSTMMVKDIVNKLLPVYKPEDIVCNFKVFIPGIKMMENEELTEYILEIKRKKERHKVICFDEAGQQFMARGYSSKVQTEIVTFCWQMPKRDIVLMYGSNIGNSADIIMRLATWVIVMPKYFINGGVENAYIKSNIIFRLDGRVMRDLITPNVYQYQKLFNSYEPIQ